MRVAEQIKVLQEPPLMEAEPETIITPIWREQTHETIVVAVAVRVGILERRERTVTAAPAS
jgi:hypothetical protein